MGSRLCFVFGLVLFIGCQPVSTSVTPLNQTSTSAKAENCLIEVLTSPPKERKYQEIAILNTVATGVPSSNPLAFVPLIGFFFRPSEQLPLNLNVMLPSMKAEACRLGAEAIIIKSVEPGDSNSPGKSFAVAIKYID